MSKSTQITKRLTAKIPTRGNDVTTLGASSVGTTQLADLSISTPKVQDQAITGAKLANDTVDFVGKHLKNYVINGNFDFWQRGTSFGSISQFTYYADRWANQSGANASASISQQALNGTQNATYCLRWTAGSTSSQFNLTQALESVVVDQLKGKTVTFSIYARVNSGNGRTYSVQIQKNATGNTLSGGSWTSLGASTPTVLSTSFQKLNVTVAIPNDGTANGLKVAILDNQTGLAADYVEIVGAMLNEGSYAAPFKMYGTNHVEELNACRRYYERGLNRSAQNTQSASLYIHIVGFMVEKRVIPTVTQIAGTTLTNCIEVLGVVYVTPSSYSIISVTSNGVRIHFPGTYNDNKIATMQSDIMQADAELT